MDSNNKILVTKLFEFAAAHKLSKPDLSDSENQKIFGECAWLHGHNYRLEVTVEGEVDPHTGMVINFKDLKELVNSAVIKKFDHSNLNDIQEFNGRVPTGENMILIIRDILLKENIAVKRLKLWETSSSLIELEL